VCLRMLLVVLHMNSIVNGEHLSFNICDDLVDSWLAAKGTRLKLTFLANFFCIEVTHLVLQPSENS
jgi:hypothetical protein